MDYLKKERIFSLGALALFLIAVTLHYCLEPWGFYRTVSEKDAALRCGYVASAENWLGCAEADGSHLAILEVYNSHEPLALGYEVQPTDSWCAAFVSAAAIDSGITDIIPTECGCQRQIDLFRELGRWQEWDNAVPQPGDLIYYDWDAKSMGESQGWSDHVGIVVGIKWPFIKVIEGNKDDCVSYRVLLLGHKSIRGYALPDFSKIS